MSFDGHALIGGGKPEAPGDAVFEKLHIRIFKLDDPFAIHADEVVVRRVVEKVRIVDFRLAAQIELSQEPALHKQRQRAVNRRPRNRPVDPARHLQQLLRAEVGLRAGRSLDNSLPLRSFAVGVKETKQRA